MKPKRRWLLLIFPLALFAWAWQAASWRPKIVGVQPTFVGNGLKLISLTMIGRGQNSLLISPDGRRLISIGQSNNEAFLIAWDVESRQKLWQQNNAGEFKLPLAFSLDGRQLAVATNKSVYGRLGIVIFLADAATGKQSGPQILPAHYLGGLQSVAFLSNRELVVATSQGASVVDTRTGKAIRQWKFMLPTLQNTKLPLPNQSHVASDGATAIVLANGTSDTAIAIYDVKTAKRRGVWTYPGVFRNPRLSPDGKLWTVEREKNDSIDVYDAHTGKKLWGPFEGNETNAPWAWSADSQRLALPKREGVSFFNARNQNFLGLVSGARSNQSLALDPRGDYLYTLDNQGVIWRWRLR